MKGINRISITCLLITLLLSACGPSPEAAVATAAAETRAAASPTPLPSDTPTPTATSTETPTPTQTSPPTIIPTPTRTRRPTSTPTITPTPGPFSYFDNFSHNTAGWLRCDGCRWTNGTLVMGPYDPSSYFHNNYCSACGENRFYRMAVDVTFIDGEVDRFFGVIFAESDTYVYYLGISPWGFYILSRYHLADRYWEDLAFELSSAVLGSYATNHLEVFVQPANNPNFADYYIYINGTLVKVVYTQEVQLTRVGLGMNYHAQVAAYDNWEYVVIEP